MNKLIITVTCDTTLTYPHNPNGPRPNNPKGLADEYVRAINVGASICHMHGSYTSDPVIQPDGRQLQIPIVEGWRLSCYGTNRLSTVDDAESADQEPT